MRLWVSIAVAAVAISLASPAKARDPLLEESVNFTGAVLYFSSGVPGLVIGAVRKGETAVAGFGRISDSVDQAPNGDTLMRVGSITKVFTGMVLASLVADGTVRLTDPLDKHLGWDVPVPTRDGRPIRLIDLVTHTSGLPREIERPPSPPDDPMRTLTKEAFIAHLKQDRLLFTPGTGAQYSNVAFDLLAAALSSAAKRPYEDLLRERVLQPAGLTATAFGQHVAPLKRCIDLHQIGQRQRHHRHPDQRVEQEEQPCRARVRGEVARADDGHAGAAGIHCGDEVSGRLAVGGADGRAEFRVHDQSCSERQPESPDPNQQHEADRTAEGQNDSLSGAKNL
nr:serine hydrolase [Microvirga massiliensis]